MALHKLFSASRLFAVRCADVRGCERVTNPLAAIPLQSRYPLFAPESIQLVFPATVRHARQREFSAVKAPEEKARALLRRRRGDGWSGVEPRLACIQLMKTLSHPQSGLTGRAVCLSHTITRPASASHRVAPLEHAAGAALRRRVLFLSSLIATRLCQRCGCTRKHTKRRATREPKFEHGRICGHVGPERCSGRGTLRPVAVLTWRMISSENRVTVSRRNALRPSVNHPYARAKRLTR